MTLDECIAYLQNISSERKPRSRKARQILNYLQDYKAILDMQDFKRRHKERGSDTPKRKYLVWYDGEEVKVMDCGYDYHTNVKTQVIVKGERGADGRE